MRGKEGGGKSEWGRKVEGRVRGKEGGGKSEGEGRWREE